VEEEGERFDGDGVFVCAEVFEALIEEEVEPVFCFLEGDWAPEVLGRAVVVGKFLVNNFGGV